MRDDSTRGHRIYRLRSMRCPGGHQDVPVRIIEVTDVGGVLVQARAQVAGKSGGRWAERRTYILSGAQFWELVSGQSVADAEAAGLIEAKRLMAEGDAHDTI